MGLEMKIVTVLDIIEYLFHIAAGSIVLYILFGFVRFMDVWSKS
jgi:Na+/H+ antiporter NhaC